MMPRLLRMSRVELISLRQFCANHGCKVVPHPHARYTPEEAVARAHSRLGERGYATLSNNCEHFVNWCLEGEPHSWIIWRMLLLLGFTLGGLRLLTCLRISGPPSRSARRLVRTGLVSLVGACAMTILTRSSLRSARGLEPAEIRYRRWGKRGAWLGLLVGLAMSLLGLRRRVRSWTLLGPFALPPLLGLLGYLLPLRPSPVAKKKLK
jgi:hypothetical protein